MYHKIIIVGNLGGDPELRYTAQGDPVTNISVATSRRWTGADGQQVDEIIWFRVSVWGKQAESANQYLSKGQMVLVEGVMQPDKATGGPRTWVGNDGQVRASYEIRAFNVRFLGSRTGAGGGSGGGADSGANSRGEQSSSTQKSSQYDDLIDEEEIPF
ncbi:MAG: hypothetical protein B6242_09660 [Anaerolineaceae bacterium 4572_78]|nr:MAG: hypothetical protein B6242_09660 [Anaerolineaceae bacterium 4572_78]